MYTRMKKAYMHPCMMQVTMSTTAMIAASLDIYSGSGRVNGSSALSREAGMDDWYDDEEDDSESTEKKTYSVW